MKTFRIWFLVCLGAAGLALGLLVQSAAADPLNPALTVTPAGDGSSEIVSSPVGIDCGGSGSTCIALFPVGTPVVLTATPAAGSAFEGFSGGGCSGTTNTCSVAMTTDQTVTGTSGLPPTTTIDTPRPGVDYAATSVPNVNFICIRDPSAALASCAAFADGQSISQGNELPSSVGTHTVTVTASDTDRLSSNPQSVSYTVSGPPTVTIGAPVDGTTYAAEAVPAAKFSCRPDPNSPTRSCAATVDGASIVNGQPLPSGAGPHSLTVTTTDADRQRATKTSHYIVVAQLPTVSITQPVDNGNYFWQSLPGGAFSCAPAFGTTLQSCTATVDGSPINNGGALPNGLGLHTVTVTATDADGQTASQTIKYTASLTLVPPVSIVTPAAGAKYHLQQVIKASYSCLATKAGAALKSCEGSVAAGLPIDTRTLGKHLFTVKATDANGQSTAEVVSYTVIPTTNTFAIGGLTANEQGVAQMVLRLPGPGVIAVRASAWSAGGPRALRRHFTYAGLRRNAKAAGAMKLSLRPGARGRTLLKASGAKPVISLSVTYTPVGAKPHTVHPKPLRVH